ncbi:MAG: hypothetical protein R2809_08785 [Flavobacteriales bacterium]
MRHLFLFILFVVLSTSIQAQYSTLKEESGVSVSTKWTKEKWYKPKSNKLLAVKLDNTTDTDVVVSFELVIYQNGVNKEMVEVEKKVIKAHSNLVGKWNGISFVPQKISQEDIAAGNYEIVIEEWKWSR